MFKSRQGLKPGCHHWFLVNYCTFWRPFLLALGSHKETCLASRSINTALSFFNANVNFFELCFDKFSLFELEGVGTKIEPTLCRADRLVGQVLGAVGCLPEIFIDLEISYYLLKRLLGVRMEGDKKGAKVMSIKLIPLLRFRQITSLQPIFYWN